MRREPVIGSRAREVGAAVALLALVLSAVLLGDDRIAPLGPASLVPTLATAVLLVVGASTHETAVARVLGTAPMRLIGRLSYSWYLWHWPFMVYLRELRRDPPLWLALGVALLSIVPAAVTYRLVETPIRFSPRLGRRAGPALVGAAALALITVVGAQAASHRANDILSSPGLAPVLAARAMPRIYADGCQLQLLQVESPPCQYGPARNDTTIVLFGDSHAAHWFPAFDSVATLRGWRLVNLTKTGCPSSTVTVTNLGRRYFECDAWRARAIQRIAQLRPQLVVLSNDKTYRVLVGDSLFLADSNVRALQEWRRGLARTMAALAPSNTRLLLLADTPQPSGDVPQCLIKYADQPSRCDTTPARALNPLTAAMERIVVREQAGVAYLDLNSLICEPDVCPVQRDGIVRYSDSNHLSVRFAASLAPQLSAGLTEALAGD